MRYVSLTVIFVNDMLIILTAKLRQFSNVAKYIIPIHEKVEGNTVLSQRSILSLFGLVY